MPKWVLIVEDDSAVLEVLETMLSERYKVITATNGKEAVNNYRMFKPDIVLMDIMMPVMDGIEATKEIKSKYPNAKIIGVTAFASQKGKEILEAGALEIIEKPFTKKKLIETIEKYLMNE
ncbi:MAG: response regulator [Archaeoglobaceae archaeon]|nr:response regulator [Archaeoglobaceae archaeon]MDW8128535.1 response regulator [Archaeoglobaceae archaeon]